jgi:3-methylcrotonyl-CoA carboxylase alpha subunit
MIFYREPLNHRVRIDACTDKAATIHSFYDPMIAKVIVWENDREHARKKMIDVLKDYISHGIKTNIRFLIELLQEKNYINNTISTKFCDDHLDELVKASEEKRGNIVNDAPITAYVLYYLKFNEDAEKPDIWHQIGYWRDVIEFNLRMDDADYDVIVYHLNKNLSRVVIDDREYIVETPHLTKNEVTIKSKEGIFRAVISHDNMGNAFVSVNGHIFNIHRDDLLIKEDVYTGIDSPDGGGDGLIFTPMPGKVVKVNIKPGDEVTKGSVLLIVEAMKMENNIVAPRDGKVEKVNVKAGKMVDGSQPLLVMEENEK